MTELAGIQEALADQIREELASGFDGIQVEPLMTLNPSADPVSIDVYPADQDPAVGGFGFGNFDYRVTIRARINTPDNDAAQLVLLQLYDSRSSTSLLQAVTSDTTLSSTVDNLTIEEGPTTFGIFPDASGAASFLGFTIIVRVVP